MKVSFLSFCEQNKNNMFLGLVGLFQFYRQTTVEKHGKEVWKDFVGFAEEAVTKITNTSLKGF